MIEFVISFTFLSSCKRPLSPKNLAFSTQCLDIYDEHVRLNINDKDGTKEDLCVCQQYLSTSTTHTQIWLPMKKNENNAIHVANMKHYLITRWLPIEKLIYI